MERIILVAPGASGKDYLARYLVNRGIRKAVTYTTRPKRDGEVNGVDYHFISVSQFEKMISEGKFYEYEIFKKDWYYGSTVEDWDKCHLFIKTVGGVQQIQESDRDDCFVVYLDIPEEVRYQRLLERNDQDDHLKRRMLADKKDFENFEDFDLRITDPNFNPELVYELALD